MRNWIIAFSIISLFSFNACENKKQAKSQGEGQFATLVEVVEVGAGKLTETIEVTGNLLANESTQLSAEVGGIIKKIHFKEGAEVKKGELLLELNNDDIKAELEEANAQKSLAESKYLRSKKLYEAKGISQEILDERESTFKEMDANQKRLTAELQKTRVYAPFDGVVGLRNISEGSFLPSTNSFTSIVDLSKLKLEFSLAEKYLNAFELGDTIYFRSRISSDRKKAVLYAIDPMVDQSSRTFTLKAIYPNEERTEKPGGFVNVYCELAYFENAISIPNQAIVPDIEGKSVYVVENSKSILKKVTVGIRKAAQIQIIKGLEKGDTVVTAGILQIRDGAPVKVRMDNSIPAKSEKE